MIGEVTDSGRSSRQDYCFAELGGSLAKVETTSGSLIHLWSLGFGPWSFLPACFLFEPGEPEAPAEFVFEFGQRDAVVAEHDE